jgi:putative salt-induced outer membrane protein
VGAQSNFDIGDSFYVLGFGQYDRDRFAGFRYEAEGGGGVGYRFSYTDRLKLSAELAPGYRYSEIRVAGGHSDEIFLRGSIMAEYKLSDNASLANELLMRGDAQRVKVENTFSVTSALIRRLAARISVNVRYNSDPPAIALKKTDTSSKVALVYGF